MTESGADALRVEFPCIILAGGGSTRFGSPKGLAHFRGLPLIEHVLTNMKRQTNGPVLINANNPSDYEAYGEMIEDPAEFRDCGPLAGILAAMIWARNAGFDQVATVPVDAPRLPNVLLQKLQTGSPPTFASTPARSHYVTGLWPVSLQPGLQAFLRSERRSVRSWLQSCSATVCTFDEANSDLAFANINTREDLERLQTDPDIDE